jgi:hypothetical protein
MHRIFIVVSLAVVLAACGGTPATNDDQQPQDGDDAGDGEGSVRVHLQVDGGELAGTYDAEGPKTDCNLGSTGSGATYLDMDKADGLYSATFISGEGGASTENFYFQALFADGTSFNDDPLMDRPEVVIESGNILGGEPSGEGTANMTESGDRITWTVDGQTEDGAGIQATIECGPVDRN